MAHLEHKVALVTGGSRGIGAAIATRLARDGATVAITYSASPDRAGTVVDAIAKAGGKAIAIQADSADADAVKQAVQTTVEKFGRLDILVNNAAVAPRGLIGEFPEADLDRALNVNIRGVFIATQEAVRHMRDGGRIIMIGSINSDYVPYSHASVYALTKGAIVGFTRGLARDLGPRGITVNNVQPGPIDTEMNPADGPAGEMMRSHSAIGRYGSGGEVASLVSYLAGPEAAYVTGAQLRIDGGASA